MDLEHVSLKHSTELEQQVTELLRTLRKAKLQQHPLYESLQTLEQALGEKRRDRYDETSSDYPGY